jgi:hypothetical protein
MEEYSLATVITCPLTNPLNYPIGVLLVGFEKEEEPTNAVAETSLVARRIVGYLND